MDGAHGVDISWLHHSHKVSEKDAPRKGQAQSDTPPAVLAKNSVKDGGSNVVKNDTVNGDENTPTTHRLHLSLHHGADSHPLPTSPSKPFEKKAATPTLNRKGSWISNLSSKFSSAQPSSPSIAASPKQATGSTDTASSIPSTPTGAKDAKKSEATGQTPPSPKSTTPSFLQSALRRLSSSGGGMGKMSSTGGGLCPRKIMNVDPYRERCQIEELQPAKLRRVSFCVDVEIAGHATYVEDEGELQQPPTPGRRPSLTELERQSNSKKAKEEKIKLKSQAEGEALKRPDDIAKAKEDTSDVKETEESVDKTPNPVTEQSTDGAKPPMSRRKEKKKRSEEERKERKEKKRLAALANGAIPLEIKRESSSSESPSPGTSSPACQQDRPTTDPLRIYKRCCQLRETPSLKRITEQLAQSNACDPLSYGTVLCLDFTGFRMQLSDIVTLGDYLAVVPVKKLIFEDCELTDEGIRVLLAGLLSVKTSDQAKYNRCLSRYPGGNTEQKTERLGVIEKLSLKNNPKIGRDGWKHIAFFIHMSQSLKAIDLSMIPFPKKPEINSAHHHHHLHAKAQVPPKPPFDPASVFEKCLIERLAGSRLEELVMAECSLSTEVVKKIVHGVRECGVTRLGLANNNLDVEAMGAVADFLRLGTCEGLDLGGNMLSDEILQLLIEALKDVDHDLYALSLADCGLTPQALKELLPALTQLPNFRFIDLSHNRQLFATQPNAISLLRRYLPRMPMLKRVHLNDVAMESEHCIALAEILPEIPHLAHLSILENPLISALALAKDETSREEACALYASLMAAVRVSETIVCIDIDLPTPEAGEIVQALAKQVVAYSLRNLERGLLRAEEGYQEKAVEVPEVLLHIVGHDDSAPLEPKEDEPAPDTDYIISGTGVVKALSVCLGNKALSDYRRLSSHNTPNASGTATPRQNGNHMEPKSKAMSKNLLGSARKIRARLQPAIANEEKLGDEMAYRRLKFLDSTLERIIQRFEDEYPECRLLKPSSSSSEASITSPTVTSSITNPSFRNPFFNSDEALDEGLDDVDPDADADGNDTHLPIKHPSRSLSRHNSDVSIASRHLAQEEGRMHRFGQKMRRDIFRPQTEDYHWGTTGEETEEEHIARLRQRMEALSGDEIKQQISTVGIENAMKALDADVEALRRIQREEPAEFEKIKVAQQHAYEGIYATAAAAKNDDSEEKAAQEPEPAASEEQTAKTT